MHIVALDDNSAKVLLALIGIIPGAIAAVFAYLAHRQTRTPSGERLGVVAERAQHLAEANTALTLGIHHAVGATPATPDVIAKISNGEEMPGREAPSG